MAVDFSQTVFATLGYSLDSVLSDSHRNICYALTKDGTTYMGKLSLTKEPVSAENDVWWCLTIARLSFGDPKAIVTAPKIFEHGPGWFVSEFIEAPVLEPRSLQLGQLTPEAEARLTSALVWLDQIQLSHQSQPDYDQTESIPYSYLLKRIEAWVHEPIEQGYISRDKVEAAKGLIERGQPYVHPSIQHGDFTPWHVFALPDGRSCVFDGEHSSLVKPRYYDLAYLYSRIFTRGEAKDSARAILRAFMAQPGLDQDQFSRQFLPVLTQRAVGMHRDAYNDRELMDYLPSAQELLELCLTQDLSALR